MIGCLWGLDCVGGAGLELMFCLGFMFDLCFLLLLVDRFAVCFGFDCLFSFCLKPYLLVLVFKLFWLFGLPVGLAGLWFEYLGGFLLPLWLICFAVRCL